MLQYQNIKIILQKSILLFGLKTFCDQKSLKHCTGTCVIGGCNDEEIIGTFYEKELQKANQKEFRINKVIRKKIYKLYVKLKGYDIWFNGWIDKKKKDVVK